MWAIVEFLYLYTTVCIYLLSKLGNARRWRHSETVGNQDGTAFRLAVKPADQQLWKQKKLQLILHPAEIKVTNIYKFKYLKITKNI